MIPRSDNPNAPSFLYVKHLWEMTINDDTLFQATQDKLDALYCKIFWPAGPTKVSLIELAQLTEETFKHLNSLHDSYQNILNYLAQYYSEDVFISTENKNG